MDLGRAVDTQRDALLRLLARLMLVIEVLSCGPFDGKVTRWVCRSLSSVLSRAELAGQYLVIGSARLLVARGVVAPEGDWLSAARRDAGVNAGASYEAVTCDSLLFRMKALKAVLEDLPRHALRLLRRIARAGRLALADGTSRLAIAAARRAIGTFRPERDRAARIDRPPDKGLAFVAAI